MSRTLRLALLLAVAGVFFYAGILKVAAPGEFAIAIERYRVFPRAPAVVIALYFPWVEILCALALLVKKFRAGALALLGTSSLVFVAMIGGALARGLDISCGCFGADASAAGRDALILSLARAALLAAACAWLLLREKQISRTP